MGKGTGDREELKVILWKEAQVNHKECSDSILENLARILQTSRGKKELTETNLLDDH